MATHDPTASDLETLLGGGGRDWRRLAPWIGGAALLVVAALTTYVLTTGGSTVATVEPEAAEASIGSITSTTSLSGTAAAAQSADLTFGATGVVTDVLVSVGDTVSAGDILATIDDTEARRQLETAQISLDQARAAYDELLADPETAEVAAALASVASANAQLLAANDSADSLESGATASEILTAESSVQTALSQLSSAEEAVNALSSTATSSEIAAAEAAVTQAEAQANSAAIELANARDDAIDAQTGYCSWEGHITGLCATTVLPLLESDSARVQRSLVDGDDSLVNAGNAFLDANSRYLAATGSHEAATATLAQAEEKLATAEGGPDPTEWFRANQALDTAQANYEIAVARLDDLRAPAGDTELEQAQASVSTAQANLASAQAKYAELVGGADVSDIERQQQSVRLAEISYERAEEGLADYQVIAPFDGVVGAIDVKVGDTVSANTVAVSLSTPEQMVIELTVSEAEVLDLEAGQVGLATFDAVGDTQFPVRILSVSTIPTSSQGVVTYAVQAAILNLADIPDVASDLQALAAAGSGGLGGFTAGGAGGGAFGGDPAAGGGGGPGGLFADIDLPEGVTIQDVLTALAAGEDLPDGVVLPEGFELPEGFADRVGGAGGGPGAVPGAGGNANLFADPDRQLPLPGMSGSVDVLLGVRDEVLLVPATAVRSQGTTSYVVIQNEDGEFERLTVITGESSGSNVEILSGLEEGDTIWINASAPATGDFSLANVDTEGGPTTGQPNQQFGPPGGFGGGFGGGQAGGGAP